MRCFRWQRHAPFSGAKSYAKTAHLFAIFLGVKIFPDFAKRCAVFAHALIWRMSQKMRRFRRQKMRRFR